MLREIVYGVKDQLEWNSNSEEALIEDYRSYVTWLGIAWDIRKNIPYDNYAN